MRVITSKHDESDYLETRRKDLKTKIIFCSREVVAYCVRVVAKVIRWRKILSQPLNCFQCGNFVCVSISFMALSSGIWCLRALQFHKISLEIWNLSFFWWTFDLSLRIAVLQKLERWSLVYSLDWFIAHSQDSFFATKLYRQESILTELGDWFWNATVSDKKTISTPKNLNSKLTSILKFAKHSIVFLHWIFLNNSSINPGLFYSNSNSILVFNRSQTILLFIRSQTILIFIRSQIILLFIRIRLSSFQFKLLFSSFQFDYDTYFLSLISKLFSSSILCPCSAGHWQIIPLSKRFENLFYLVCISFLSACPPQYPQQKIYFEFWIRSPKLGR